MDNRIELLLKAVLSNDSITGIKQQVKDLQSQLDNIKVDGNLAKVLNEVAKTDFSKTGASTFATDLNKVENEAKKAQEEIERLAQKANQKLSMYVEIDSGRVRGDFDAIKKDIESRGGQVNFEMKTDTSQITKLTATFDEFGKKVTDVYRMVNTGGNDFVWEVDRIKTQDSAVKSLTQTYEGIQKTITDLGNQGQITKSQMEGFLSELDKVSDSQAGMERLTNSVKEIASSNTNIDKLNNQLEKLEATGKITAEQFEQLNQAINKSGNINTKSFGEINQQMDLAVISTKNLREETKRLTKEELDLEAALIKVEQQRNNIVRATKQKPVIQRDEGYAQLSVDLDNIEKKLREGTISGKQFDNMMRQTNASLNGMTAKATEVQRMQVGLVRSFQIAMEKFSVWMGATTIFYGSIRSAREFMSIIIDIDTKMTDLRKVMAEGTDFDQVFDRATESAEKFGRTISETMDAYIEFAKQGFTDNELGQLADAATVMGNVADMTSKLSAEFLTSSLVQWGKESNEAMDIADKWNEIGNNFPTTAENIAQAQARAGSVAKAMGLSFEELNAMAATLTATMKQSGNEIGNMIKSTLPRLTSKPAQSVFESLNIDMLDAEGNMKNVIGLYREVAIALKDANELEKTMAAEGLAGKFHIARMQALLDQLAKTDSMYDQVMASQEGATNSAIEENEQYLKSFEARLAGARREVEILALALGDAFLSEGMVQGIKLFSEGAAGLSDFINQFGALSVLVPAVGLAILVFSKNFRAMMQAMTFGGGFLTQAQREMTGITAEMTRMEIAGRALKGTNTTMSVAAAVASKASIAVKGLLMSFGLTAGLALVGTLLEKFIGKITEGRQAAEEMRNKMDESRRAYADNGEEIKRLTAEYKGLQTALGSSDLGEEERIELSAKLLETQQSLAAIMPSAKVAEDEYGNAIYATVEAIELRNSMMERQIALQEKIDQAEQATELNEYIKQQEKDIVRLEKQMQKSIETIIFSTNNLQTSFGGMLTDLDIESIKDLESAQIVIEEITKALEQARQSGDMEMASNLEEILGTVTQDLDRLAMLSSEVQAKTFEIIQAESYAYEETINNIYEAESATRSVLASMGVLLAQAGATGDEAKDIFNTLANSMQGDLFKGISNEYDLAMQEMQKAKEAYDLTPNIANEETLNEAINRVKVAYSSLQVALTNTLDSSGADKTVIGNVIQELEDLELVSLSKLIGLEEAAKSLGKTTDEAALAIRNLGLDIDEVGETGEESFATVEDAIRGITGATTESIDEIWDFINEMEKMATLLSVLTEGTAEYDLVSRQLASTEESLLNMYPQLRTEKEAFGLTTQEIILRAKQETEATDVLHSAYVDFANGTITSNQMRVVDTANSARKNIDSLMAELNAINTVNNAMRAREGELAKMANEAGGTWAADAEHELLLNHNQMQRNSGAIERARKELEGYKNELGSAINVAKQYPTYSKRNTDRVEKNSNATGKNSKSKKDNTKAKKDNTKATKESSRADERASFIADQYKRAIDEVNLALKQQTALRSQMSTYTKDYQAALSNELKLEKEKLKLMKEQEKAMRANVARGDTMQTGVITEQRRTGGTTTTSNRKLSGWQAPVNSKFGQRWGRMHEGVDIAQPLGTRLESNIEGIVKKAFNHKSYGNVVYVVDNSGTEHRYAHLNKLGVKAGQRVGVGSYLGDIGSTGNSTGSHLHYETRRNGKALNPMSYVNAAKGNKQVTTTTGGDVINVQKEIAQQASDIFGLESDILGIQGDIIDQQMRIAELQADMIRAELAMFEQRRKSYGFILDYESSKYEQVSKASQRYLDILMRQETFMRHKQNTNLQEFEHLEKMIKSGRVQGALLDEMRDKYNTLKIEISNMNIELSKMREMQIEAQMYKWALATEEYEYNLALLDQTIQSTVEGSAKWLELMEQRTKYLESQRSAIKQEIDQLTQLLRMTNLLTPEAVEEYNRRLRELTLQYRELGLSIKDSEENLEDMRKAENGAWADVAERMIDAYKKAMEEKRDIHMKNLEYLTKAENDRHDQVIKNLNEEMDNYRNLINERIKEIDKEDSDRSYQQEIEELQKERQKLEAEKNLRMMDDSREAGYERKRLEEQIDAITKQIEEKRYQREKELRKENLNEMLEDKEKEVADREEVENKYHDSEIERIDKIKDYWDKYYTDQINDERKFSQWRQDIANGDYEHIVKLMDDLGVELEDSLGSITDTLGGLMEGVGTSIRQNIIDELREALRLLEETKNKIDSQTNTSVGDLSGGLSGSGGSSGSSGGAAKYQHADLQVIAGKLMRHNLAENATTQADKRKYMNRGTKEANAGRTRGSSIDDTASYDSLIATMNKTDTEAFIRYLEGYARNLPEMEYELRDWLNREARRLRVASSFDTGGYTGSWGAQGKVAWLHEKELVLNQKETNKFGNILAQLNQLGSALSAVKNGQGQGDILINFQVDKMNATEEEAKQFGTSIIDQLKQKRGIR